VDPISVRRITVYVIVLRRAWHSRLIHRRVILEFAASSASRKILRDPYGRTAKTIRRIRSPIAVVVIGVGAMQSVISLVLLEKDLEKYTEERLSVGA
jgi:hypothetical protein